MRLSLSRSREAVTQNGVDDPDQFSDSAGFFPGIDGNHHRRLRDEATVGAEVATGGGCYREERQSESGLDGHEDVVKTTPGENHVPALLFRSSKHFIFK